jgi:DEAD/DEAH box helicase domain-containing protein
VTNDKPTDYAALIRAANQTVGEPPEWLTTGKHVYSPEYGVGEVMALLGKRLIVKFVEEVNPTQFGDWKKRTQIITPKSNPKKKSSPRKRLLNINFCS